MDTCNLAPGIRVQLIFHISKFHMKIPRSGLRLAQAGSEQPNLLTRLGVKGRGLRGVGGWGVVFLAHLAHLPVIELFTSELKPNGSDSDPTPTQQTQKDLSEMSIYLFSR